MIDAAHELESVLDSEPLSLASHDWVRYGWRLDRIGGLPAVPTGYEIVAELEPDEDSVLSVVCDAYASDPTWLAEMPAIRARMRRRVHESRGREGVAYVTARQAGALVAVSGVAARHWTGQNLITGICVAPGHQRRGIGSLLLGASLEWLRDSCSLREASVYTELGSLADRKLYPLFGGRRERDVIYPGANDTVREAGRRIADPSVAEGTTRADHTTVSGVPVPARRRHRAASADLRAVHSALSTTRDERLGVMSEFLALPSISADPAHRPSCRAAAAWLATRLAEVGVAMVRIDETPGNPIVYGEHIESAGAPTILIYGHYDVQPVDPLDAWLSPPFEARIAGGRIRARGAADDKGQICLQVDAVGAWLAVTGKVPVNLRFVFEGEEESGSPNLEPWLLAHRDDIASDAVVISDTEFADGNLPAITIGMRGHVGVEVSVAGPAVDLHSGEHGGAVVNPLIALCAIVARLKSPSGRVKVPGFYDDVVVPSDRDRAALAVPIDVAAYQDAIGVTSLGGEERFSVVERRTIRPTLDVVGIQGGYVGPGMKTIVPARAIAKLSCRIVPDQEPAKIRRALHDAIARATPPGVVAVVTDLGVGAPYAIPIDHPLVTEARGVLEEEFGASPVLIRGGGSIPAADSFHRMLGIDVLLLGFAPPDAGAHGPNESMDLANYETGVRAIAGLWFRLAQRWQAGHGRWA